jgi:hypothetical protein
VVWPAHGLDTDRITVLAVRGSEHKAQPKQGWTFFETHRQNEDKESFFLSLFFSLSPSLVLCLSTGHRPALHTLLCPTFRGESVYTFWMQQPVPTYRFAFALPCLVSH